MEHVPLVERSISRLQSANPVLLFRLWELAGLTAWTWFALFLATLAAVRRLLNRTRNSALHLTTRIVTPILETHTPEVPDLEPISRSSSTSSVEDERGSTSEKRVGVSVQEVCYGAAAMRVSLAEMAASSRRSVVRTWAEEEEERVVVEEGDAPLSDDERWGVRRRRKKKVYVVVGEGSGKGAVWLDAAPSSCCFGFESDGARWPVVAPWRSTLG